MTSPRPPFPKKSLKFGGTRVTSPLCVPPHPRPPVLVEHWFKGLVMGNEFGAMYFIECNLELNYRLLKGSALLYDLSGALTPRG